ncbi:MAG: peptidase C11 [Oscillibacter sp.]|nr:peptidase C11 [Oscillibacter sp.]
MDNRPRGREKNVTGGGAGVHRRGEGLGTGKVGSGSGMPQRPAGGGNGGPQRSGGQRSGGTRGGVPLIAILLALLLGGGGGLGALSGLFGGSSSTPSYTPSTSYTGSASSGGSAYSGSVVQSLFSTGAASAGDQWTSSANTGKLNTAVAPEARAKFTTLRGGGKDTVTILVYMCGTDLESKNSMATSDLSEMAKATIGSNVNLIVYTGGCRQWQNNAVSSQVNQIWQVKNGGLTCLNQNAGTASMTDPGTLQSFLKWGGRNYPADRTMLIFWDHGGGSLSGYGYDEKNPSSGSMTLSQIDGALAGAGLKYDFVGFDACLMATAETALMLSKYADYLIASEETEPGVGWYYTNWLTELSANTSLPTIEVGKKIADDFVDVCARTCRGQQTTLSVVDLAELGETLGDEFAAFAKDTRELIQNDGYQTVSSARSGAREFAASSAIDQIDLVHFARNLGTDEGEALAQVLLSAVKYNRTGNMTNAYGLSIYFPYKKASKVDQAVDTYDRIGVDDEYSACIREFASLEVSGQAVSGGTASPLGSLLGGSASQVSSGDIAQLLGLFLGGDVSSVAGLTAGNTGFLSGRSLSDSDIAAYLAEKRFDPSYLTWTDGRLLLPQEQWDLVQGLDLNVFYDDGTGYVDLGLDNVYEFDASGNLLGETDGTWLSINGQPVAYYHLSTAEEGEHYTITGYVPALLNGERMELILIFSDETPYGYIAGARPAYADGETETVARGLTEVLPGDTLDFLCDYYSYDGQYQDSYFLGEQMTVTDQMTISNTYLGEGVLAMYRFTDLYGQHYWTDPMD